MTDFTIILRSLLTRRFSTLTTILSVALGVGLMLVLISMRDAGRQAFARGTGNMHLYVSRDASPMVSVLNGIFYANAPQRAIEWSKYEQLANAFPLEFAIPTQLGDSYLGFPVLATVPAFFKEFEPNAGESWKLAAGRIMRDEHQPLPPGEKDVGRADGHAYEVVVGARAAKATGLRVGDELFLTHGIAQSRQLGDPGAMEPHVHREFTYRVVGILEPTGSAHDGALFTHLHGAWIIHAHDKREAREAQERDGSAGGHDHETRTTLADVGPDEKLITGILLRVATRPGQQVTSSLQTVFDQLRRDPTITVAQPVQQINALFRIVSNIDQVFIALAAAVMLSSGVGIMLALYNSMNERRRQIAVLRVLGCSQGRVFGLVLTESAIIGLLGAVAGVVLAYAGSLAVAGVLKREIGLTIQPAFAIETVLVVLFATLALACLAGLFPAILAYRTPVANNLKAIG
jgi:putative ABC transport system permease protein